MKESKKVKEKYYKDEHVILGKHNSGKVEKLYELYEEDKFKARVYYMNEKVGFTNSRPIRQGLIENSEGQEIGFITSSNKSFNLNKFIGMGYIRKEALQDEFNGDLKMVDLPFIPNNYYKPKTISLK